MRLILSKPWHLLTHGHVFECLRNVEQKPFIKIKCFVKKFIFAIVVDVVTELERDDMLSELPYANDLILMSETIEGLRNKIMK